MTPYLTSKDVMKLLQVSEWKALEIMVSAGAVNVGFGTKNSCWRLSQPKLEAWLESRTAKVPDDTGDQAAKPKARKTQKAAAPEIDWREGFKKKQFCVPHK